MSKAFTKENDSETDDPIDPGATPQPAGTKNYITPHGAEKLRSELKQLIDVTRPEVVATVAWAASNGDRSENADYIYGKRRLREIDRRIRFLTKRLEIAEIVNPVDIHSDRVRFGATVTVADEQTGDQKTYSIVGIDETDVKRGHISWISPLGRALLGAKIADSVTYRTPQGDAVVEVVTIEFKDITRG